MKIFSFIVSCKDLKCELSLWLPTTIDDLWTSVRKWNITSDLTLTSLMPDQLILTAVLVPRPLVRY